MTNRILLQNHKKVIPFPEPDHWRFYDLVESGRNRIEEWYQELSDEAQQQFNSLLKNLRKISDHTHWSGWKYLKGKPKEERIWQLDFIADRRQYRVLGVFGLGKKKAAFLVGCYHKGPTYTPPDAMNIAVRRAKQLKSGRAETHERKVRDDI